MKTRRKVWRLGWQGMKQVFITVDKISKNLVIDDWFYPRVGNLCINANGSLDVCKKIYFQPPPNMYFNGSTMYKFKYSKQDASRSCLVRIKRGKKLKFKGRIFTYKDNPNLDEDDKNQ